MDLEPLFLVPALLFTILALVFTSALLRRTSGSSSSSSSSAGGHRPAQDVPPGEPPARAGHGSRAPPVRRK